MMDTNEKKFSFVKKLSLRKSMMNASKIMNVKMQTLEYVLSYA